MNSKRRSSEYHLPKCPMCGFPDSMSADAYARKMQEDRFQYESLRRAVQKMIEAGASPKEVTNEIMWRLEIRVREPLSFHGMDIIKDPRLRPMEMRMERPRIHPEWGRGGGYHGN